MQRKAILRTMTTFLIFLLPCSCRTINQESKVRHLEADIINPGPAFLWHQVPAEKLGKYIQSQLYNDAKAVPQNAEITKRMQYILDYFDTVARRLKPIEMQKIPKPVAAILDVDEPNANVSSRYVCVRQWVKTHKAPDLNPAELPKMNSSKVSVIDMSDLGSYYETTVPLDPAPADPSAVEPWGACEIVEPATIGWDGDKFVEMYNAHLPVEEQNCSLEMNGTTMVLPDSSDCGSISGDYQNVLRFSAQANIIFFKSGLLRNMTEPSVAVVAAHELSHFYRAHLSDLASFEPYFFLQTKENELKRPEPTLEYESIRMAMLDSLGFQTAPRIDGARFDSNLFKVTSYLRSEFLRQFCEDSKPCNLLLTQLNAFADLEEDFSIVYEDIGRKALTGKTKDLYLRYESLFASTLASIAVTDLTMDQRESILDDVPTYLQKYFRALDQQENLLVWFEDANQSIVDEIPKLEAAFENAASLGLGYYSTEEEADEIGFELAARSGISRDEVAATWLEFMDIALSYGSGPSFLATPPQECKEWHKNKWKDGDVDIATKLRIDGLSDPHHGTCYRLFNAEREWDTHQMSQWMPSSGGLLFDQVTWQDLQNSLKGSESISMALTQTPQAGIQSSLKHSHQKQKRPACIFSPRKTVDH